MTNKPIRVLIADDHKMLLEGLSLFLEDDPGFEVVGTTTSGRAALELALELEPDVLLLDVIMPDMNGLEVLSSIEKASLNTAVILLTSYRNTEYLSRALALGATGYLVKEVGLKMIPQAIRAILEGEAVIDKALLQEALQALSQTGTTVGKPKPSINHELTDQEYRILVLLAQGLTNDAIAEALSISRNTVKTHVSRVYEKIGVSDRTQAAIWAIRHGVVG